MHLNDCFLTRWVTQEKSKTVLRLWLGYVSNTPYFSKPGEMLPYHDSHLAPFKPGLSLNYLCKLTLWICSFQFFASMLTYPFVLVSNLMAVNNCGWVKQLVHHTFSFCYCGGFSFRVTCQLPSSFPSSRLSGGLPPYASVYPTWVDCWRHLSLEVSDSHTHTHTQTDFYTACSPGLFHSFTANLSSLLPSSPGQHEPG